MKIVRELVPTSFEISDLRMGFEDDMQKIITGRDGEQVLGDAAALPGTAKIRALASFIDTSGQDHDRAVALMMEGDLSALMSVEAVTSEKVRWHAVVFRWEDGSCVALKVVPNRRSAGQK